jgi:hypothetical protein
MNGRPPTTGAAALAPGHTRTEEPAGPQPRRLLLRSSRSARPFNPVLTLL